MLCNLNSLNLKSKQKIRQKTYMPFKLYLGTSLYKPSMKDANSFFKSFNAGKFGSGVGYNLKFIFRKKYPHKKFNLILTFDYLIDSIQESNPDVSLNRHESLIEHPNYISTQSEKLMLKFIPITLTSDYYLQYNKKFAFSMGVGVGLGLLRMQYYHAKTVIDGSVNRGRSHNKLAFPLQAHLNTYFEISKTFQFLIDARNIYVKWQSKDEIGYNVDTNGFIFGAGVVFSQ